MRDCCASSYPSDRSVALEKLVPVIEVSVNGRTVRALVDTGCSRTMVKSSIPVCRDGGAQ